MKISIIGAGKWGMALYSALREKNDCVITSRTKRDIENFVSIKEAIDRDLLIFAISTQHIKEFLKSNFINKDQSILVASKGIEASSGKFLSEIFSDFIDIKNYIYLSGPSFASEVIKKLPCALVLSSEDELKTKELLKIFPNYIKTYYSSDVIGAEICGAYKNVIAIASGISDGMGLGNNARASLIARGLVEMNRFGKFFGAIEDTFLGLSGAGDLFLTATSAMSRNYRVGFELAKNKKLDDILKEIGEVAEGVNTSKAILKIAANYGIYTPVATEVALIINGKDVKESLKDLLRKK